MDEILARSLEHLGLVALATSLAVALGLPLGVFAARNATARRPIVGVANVLQTIPSLALLGFLLPVPLLGGIGARPAIVALVLYALLPIVRATDAGLRGVDPAVIEAGRGLGMTDRQILFHVQVPLAAGVILAGVRVATVASVGVATIAAAIGAGGLGTFIFRGVAMVDHGLILRGAVPAAVLALLCDAGLGLIERRLRRKGS
jgi:osmoprotectant transport system permease protein